MTLINKNMVKWRFSWVFLVLVAFIGCNQMKIYESISLGSPLSKPFLKNAEQIIIHNNRIFVTLDISDDIEYYDPHLCVFEDKVLVGACYLPTENIWIKGDTILGNLNDSRKQRIESFGCDLPDGALLKMLPKKMGRSAFRETRKVKEFTVSNLENIAFLTEAEGEVESRADTFRLEQLHLSRRDYMVSVYLDLPENPVRLVQLEFIDRKAFDVFQDELVDLIL
jgi:hypothetical protein